jgi:KipI family sensor histidine kinase inhibitor
VGTPQPRLRFSGDTLLLVELGDGIDPATHARVMQVAAHVAAAGLPGVRDVVPAYASVGIHFDPLHADLSAIERTVKAAPKAAATSAPSDRAVVEIPVCYGGAHGPDLDQLAAWSGLTAEEVVQRHAGRTYRVYMLGFVPGFAYMAHVDPAIAVPRRRVPRERVPVGSVGIAGEQTCVYPSATPGGWYLIGRSPVRQFDATAVPPSRCLPGDTVRFVRITATEFAELALAPDGIGGGW